MAVVQDGLAAFRAVFPLEGVRPRPSWTTAEAGLSYSLDIYHYIQKGEGDTLQEGGGQPC